MQSMIGAKGFGSKFNFWMPPNAIEFFVGIVFCYVAMRAKRAQQPRIRSSVETTIQNVLGSSPKSLTSFYKLLTIVTKNISDINEVWSKS